MLYIYSSFVSARGSSIWVLRREYSPFALARVATALGRDAVSENRTYKTVAAASWVQSVLGLLPNCWFNNEELAIASACTALAGFARHQALLVRRRTLPKTGKRASIESDFVKNFIGQSKIWHSDHILSSLNDSSTAARSAS